METIEVLYNEIIGNPQKWIYWDLSGNVRDKGRSNKTIPVVEVQLEVIGFSQPDFGGVFDGTADQQVTSLNDRNCRMEDTVSSTDFQFRNRSLTGQAGICVVKANPKHVILPDYLSEYRAGIFAIHTIYFLLCCQEQPVGKVFLF